jgi:hypothetical protein
MLCLPLHLIIIQEQIILSFSLRLAYELDIVIRNFVTFKNYEKHLCIFF